MLAQFKSKFIEQTLLCALGVSCLFSITNLQSLQVKQISQGKLTKEAYLEQEQSERLKLSFLQKMPSFGFENLVSDWVMLQFLQYFGDDDARDITGYSLSADYMEVITENDPLFSRAYMIISPASSMFAGTPERTVAIMNKGLSKMSANTTDAYYVWLYKGVDEILFLGDLEEAEKSYKMSADWADKAGNKQIAESASGTAKFLATKPNINNAQISVWFMVWMNNKDEYIRQIAKAKIENLGGKLEVRPDGRVVATPPKNNPS